MYVLGIDVGTTLTKALILTKEGKVAASGSKGYPLISNGSHIEQRADVNLPGFSCKNDL
jgi:sugar (pentulose or hexulose) kinase